MLWFDIVFVRGLWLWLMFWFVWFSWVFVVWFWVVWVVWFVSCAFGWCSGWFGLVVFCYVVLSGVSCLVCGLWLWLVFWLVWFGEVFAV